MTRRVVVVVFPELQILDLTGPLEVFSAANGGAGRDEYALDVVSSDGAFQRRLGVTPGEYRRHFTPAVTH